MRNLLLAAATASLLAACASKPYKSTNKIYKNQVKQLAKTIGQYPLADSFSTAANWVGTTNLNLRKPNFVIIHHTAQNSCEQTLKTFTLARTQVSAHYVICRDGTIHHMLNDYLRAWHAGIGKWGSNSDINSSSIGIELDNNGSEPFTQPQISSLLQVLGLLKKAFSIPTANFIGHQDIAPGRKVDPSVLFNWKQLADNGYGLWYGDTTNVVLPPDFNPTLALRIVGYDIKNDTAAIQTFNRHWMGLNKTDTLSINAKKALYSLMKKSM